MKLPVTVIPGIAEPLTAAEAFVVDVFILCCECLLVSFAPGAVGILDATKI